MTQQPKSKETEMGNILAGKLQNVDCEYIIGDLLQGKSGVYMAIYEAMEAYAASKQAGVGNVWQLCPKCQGQGNVEKPPGMPVEVQQWSSNQTSFVCDVCGGAKIIAQSSQQVGEENRRLREALEGLVEAVPGQTNDADWWPDELTKAFGVALAALSSVSDAGNKEE